jgi:hypothetical protein
LVRLDQFSRTRLFAIAAILFILAVVGFGATYFIFLVGFSGDNRCRWSDLSNVSFNESTGKWQLDPGAPPPQVPYGQCAPLPKLPKYDNGTLITDDVCWSEHYQNLFLQLLTLLFSCALLLTVPWRVANLVHLHGWCGANKRPAVEGRDFYGRPADGIWWHLPRRKRRFIVYLLWLNILFQVVTQATRILWCTYAASQTVLGGVFINVTFAFAIIFGFAGGVKQLLDEKKLRRSRPGEFPPTPLDYAQEAMRAWRAACVSRSRFT